MGASRRCLLPVCLILLGTPTTPAQLSDDDRSSHQTDLSARILAGSPLEGRQLLGQASALVSAAQGKAFVLESVEGQPSARAIKTSTPVYKAFGMNASGERLLYRPLAGNAPSGELVVEELATGATRRFSSRHALEAAWSPRDRDLLAFTFASGQGYGLALLNVRTRRLQVVWSDEVLADYLAWEADGSGVYYYRAVEKERVGVAGDTGLVVAEHSYPGGGEWAGTLFKPALVYPVPEAAQLYRAEQFGPILPVSVIDSPEQALDAIERSDVGQQASLFGRDAATIGRLVDHLANLVCRVNVNTKCRRGPDVYPFAGRKDSAVGTLSVTDALRVFSIRSMVAATESERPLFDALGSQSVFLAPPSD